MHMDGLGKRIWQFNVATIQGKPYSSRLFSRGISAPNVNQNGKRLRMAVTFVQLATYCLPSTLDGSTNLYLPTDAVTERTFLVIHICEGPPLSWQWPICMLRPRNSKRAKGACSSQLAHVSFLIRGFNYFKIYPPFSVYPTTHKTSGEINIYMIKVCFSD